MIMMMEESGGSDVLPLLTSEIKYQQGIGIMRLLVEKRKSHENDFNLDQDYTHHLTSIHMVPPTLEDCILQ